MSTHRAGVRAFLVACAMVMWAGCSAHVQTPPAARVPETLPREAARFSITGTTDSTVFFRANDVYWVRAGMTGYAVDPARRDAFIAQLSVLYADRGLYTALVTGQVRPVDTTHVVLLVRPGTPWYRTRPFWSGVVLGGLFGAGAAMILR